MTIAAAVLSTVVLIMLVLIWLRSGRRVKCRNCLHFAEHYMTSIHGQGIYRFGYCQRELHDCKLVDPDVERECPSFEQKDHLASVPT